VTDIPIIFSAPMVRALLEGRKTMTRRLAWRDAPCAVGNGPAPSHHKLVYRNIGSTPVPFSYPPSPWQRVQIGDRLWVRENFAKNANQLSDTFMDTSIVYAADGKGRALDNGTEKPWTPCIHMPRWASRLTLIVTATKIEPLQAISEEDARREGWQRKLGGEYLPGEVHYDAARDWFSDLWGDLHGVESWRANPDVVAISFRVIKANIDQPEAKAA
jgi:hypothetical protein